MCSGDDDSTESGDSDMTRSDDSTESGLNAFAVFNRSPKFLNCVYTFLFSACFENLKSLRQN